MICNQKIDLAHTVITLYTSPFQRCVDTSIGVIKGLYRASNNWKNQPILRIDLGLGEWMCERFFNEVCPASRLLLKQHEKLARQQANTFSILAKDKTLTFQDNNNLLPPFKMDYSYSNPKFTEFNFPETYTDMLQRFQDTRLQCLNNSQQQQEEIIIFITHAVGVNALLDSFRNCATIPLESNYCSISCVRHISLSQALSDEQDSSEFMDSPQTPTKRNNWQIELSMSDSHLSGSSNC